MIDLAAIDRAVAAARYTGPVEVEVFNADVWQRPGADVLADLVARTRRS